MFRKSTSPWEVVNRDILLSREGRRIRNCRFHDQQVALQCLLHLSLKTHFFLLCLQYNLLLQPRSFLCLCLQIPHHTFVDILIKRILFSTPIFPSVWIYVVRQMGVRGNILVNTVIKHLKTPKTSFSHMIFFSTSLLKSNYNPIQLILPKYFYLHCVQDGQASCQLDTSRKK